MEFTYFAGNPRVKKSISAMVDADRVPHALLIEGEDGLGKKTLARELARALVCRGEKKPCCECAQCVKALKGVHPDIYEYCAPGSANSFHIDKVRDVISSSHMLPNEARYKIYLLENAHCMNEPAQNALLKILEEPPDYAVFILTARSRSYMLETVLSRVTCVSLSGITPQEGLPIILSRLPEISEAQAKSAIITFGGNVGKAVESLSGGGFEKLISVADEVCACLAGKNEFELMKALSPLVSGRSDTLALVNMLTVIFRDALTGRDMLSGREQSIRLLRHAFTSKKLLDLFEASRQLASMALKNANQQLLITKISCDLSRAAGK